MTIYLFSQVAVGSVFYHGFNRDRWGMVAARGGDQEEGATTPNQCFSKPSIRINAAMTQPAGCSPICSKKNQGVRCFFIMIELLHHQGQTKREREGSRNRRFETRKPRACSPLENCLSLSPPPADKSAVSSRKFDYCYCKQRSGMTKSHLNNTQVRGVLQTTWW